MGHPVIIIFGIIVAILALFYAWKRFTIPGNVYTLTKSVDLSSLSDPGEFALIKFKGVFGGGNRLSIPLDGSAKKAHARLIKMGPRALPTLQAQNRRLIAKHKAYSDWLKSGPSRNPYENYGRRSDAEKKYRYVIELQQARIVDVIEAIETGRSV